MTEPLTLGAAAVVALSCAISGFALLFVGLARLSAALLVLTGVSLAVSIAAAVVDQSVVSMGALIAAGALLGPASATAYPRLRWRHPVDFLAVTAIVVCGVLGTLLWQAVEAVEALGWVVAVVLALHTWWRIERSWEQNGGP